MSNIIWTKHAEERNRERQITQAWIEKTINNPDNYSSVEGGRIKCIKSFGSHTVTAITTKTDSGSYLILSAWVNPPIAGTNDHRKENYNKTLKKSSGFKKLLVTLRNQLGF